jgi:hypothetical protein
LTAERGSTQPVSHLPQNVHFDGSICQKYPVSRVNALPVNPPVTANTLPPAISVPQVRKNLRRSPGLLIFLFSSIIHYSLVIIHCILFIVHYSLTKGIPTDNPHKPMLQQVLGHRQIRTTISAPQP